MCGSVISNYLNKIEEKNTVIVKNVLREGRKLYNGSISDDSDILPNSVILKLI